MNLARCKSGHFYDEDKYDSCPHCGDSSQSDNNTLPVNRNDSVTVSATQAVSEDAATRMAGSSAKSSTGSSLEDAVRKAQSGEVVTMGEDSPTISYYKAAIGIEPVIGWLVCVEGEHLGEDFRLTSGRNFIGRSVNMDVAITGDKSVARERHAVVVYDPKSFVCLVQAGDAKELCYLNDKVVLGAEELKAGDALTLGNTKLRFFPCCSKDFNWESMVAGGAAAGVAGAAADAAGSGEQQ